MENTALSHTGGRPRLPARTVPPYHTGKVAIGLAHIPTQRPAHDRDACRLQDALLVDAVREAAMQRELRAETRLAVFCSAALVVMLGLLVGGVL